MKFKKFTAALAATTMVLSTATVTAFAETVNTHKEVYEAKIAKNIALTSISSTVTYNCKGKITPLTQKNYGECATTCAGMCVNKTRDQLVADGFNMQWADWEGIGKEYEYTVDWLGRSDINGTYDGLQKIYNYLKAGYPVCVWINDVESTYHWVVVYKYSGNGTNFKASDFMCIDPARSWTSTTRDRRLDLAVNYAGIYNTVVFK
ncbi:MAG: C39 family peptidase [Oscillospiraceae bacterium]|nr:C39 family peptidase [Oscillospiraceae bacterium]